MNWKPTAVIFDIDGTLAKREWHDGCRGPYDWDRVGEDVVYTDMITMVRMCREYGYRIIFVSGRSDICATETLKWLDYFGIRMAGDQLYMRPHERLMDPDTEIKYDIYKEFIEPAFRVYAVFDDRDKVVKMWRERLGLRVFQVAEGNF